MSDHMTTGYSDEAQSNPSDGTLQKYGTMSASNAQEAQVSQDGGLTSCLARIYPDGFLIHLKALWAIGWPITIIQITQYLLGTVAIMFCGHLDRISLDAVALADSLINVAGISIAVGMSTACDTLFAQIYGSTNKRLIGVVLQRSILIMFLTCLPCWAIHLNTEQILLLLGQHPDVSRLTGSYMLICMPGMMFFFIYCAIVKYLEIQNIVYPSMILGVIAFLLNVLLHYVLLYVMDMGTVGSAIAQSVSYSVMCLLNIGYIVITGLYKYTWSGWTWECWQEWDVFFKLGLGGLFTVCVEWWSLEVSIILSGTLGTVDLAAQSILLQLDFIWYTFPLGISSACSIITGQFLGAGNAKKAKTAARVALTVAAILGLFFCIFWVTLREYLPHLFSSDEAVVQLVSQVLPILGVYTVVDGIASVCSGVFRGMGKQHVGAIAVLTGYVCGLSIGLPTMLCTQLGIAGFWTGLAVTLCVDGIVYYTFIHFSDWNKVVLEAMERTKSAPFEGGTGTYNEGCEKDDPTECTKLKTENDSQPPGMPIIGRTYSKEISVAGNLAGYEEVEAAASPMICPTHLSTRQLLLRRGLFILFCIGSLVTGVIARNFTEIKHTEVTSATIAQPPALLTGFQTKPADSSCFNSSNIP